ncbi:MAG: hypothetical protein ACRD0A_05835 [Acidimicrobiales bacterium]
MVRDRVHRRGRAAARLAVALAVLGAGFVVGQAPASAAPTGFFIEGRQFFSIDLATGESDQIGSTGVDEQFSALAFGPDGTLFAVADSHADDDPETQQFEPAELYTIDVGTGAATLVGMLTENNDTGLLMVMTALTFSQDGVALLTGLAPGEFETVFVVDIDGASSGLVPVSRLTDDSGFLTIATDTACEGTVFGLSIEVPERDTDETAQPTTETINTLPGQPGQLPSGAIGGRVTAQPTPPLVGQPPPGAGGPGVPGVQDPRPAIPMVLTTIDPDTGATTEVGPIGLNASGATIPGLAIDRGTGTLWGEVIDGRVFTLDGSSGTADLSAGTTANDIAGTRRPQNLAISPVSCSQPTTTTTTSTTTTSTTVVTEDDPDAPPPADPATPVPAEPNFTG